MGNSEVIGGVSVTISGDYSSLADDFAAAADVASESGAQVAQAFQSGGASVADAGTALQQAGEQAETASPQLEAVAESEKHAGEAAESTTAQLKELIEKLAEFAGIALTAEALKEFAVDAVMAADNVDRVTLSLTAMTGSATGATETVEGLKALALEDALSFPGLLEAAQRMTAFGVSSEQIPAIMRAAADASAATGNSFDQVSNAIIRVGSSGMVSARFLMQLGLTQQDLASTLGTTTDKLQEQFKALDQEARIQAIIAALGKFQGQAELVANTVGGKWQILKTNLETDSEGIGNALRTDTIAAIEFANSLLQLSQGGERASVTLRKLYLELESFLEWVARDEEEAAKLSIEADDLEESFQKAQTSTAKWTESTKELPPALVATKDEIEAATAAAHAHAMELQKLYEITQSYVSPLTGLIDETDRAQLADTAATQSTIQLANALVAAERNVVLVSEAYVSGTATLAQYNKALEEQSKLQGELDKLRGTAPTIDPAPIDAAKIALEGVVQVYAQVTPYVNTLEQVDAWWSKQSGHVNKLAKTDLPEAIKQYEIYIANLREVGAPLGEIYAAEEKEMQLKISSAEQSGTDATKEILQLQQIKLAQQALIDQASLLGNTYVAVQNEILHGFQNIGKAIGTNIIAEKNWGQVFKQEISQVGESILSTLVGNAFKALENSIIGIAVKTLPQLASSFDASAAIGAEAVKVANAQTVLSDAWVADAGTFAWWSSINPMIAPEMGAAAQAEVSAMAAPAGSFEIGGMVPSDMLAQVHAGEWITPAGSVEANAGFGGAGGQNATFVLQGCTLYASNVDDLMNQMVKSLRRIGARI